jgi:hypothetical protein
VFQSAIAFVVVGKAKNCTVLAIFCCVLSFDPLVPADGLLGVIRTPTGLKRIQDGATSGDEKQSVPEPTMKRLSLVVATIFAIAFLPVFLSGCGVRNGQGTKNYPNGAKYVGELKDGKPNGYGTFTLSSGWRTTGEFKDGLACGQGTLTVPGGLTYVGEFQDGKPNGQGTETWVDGRKFVGQYKDGRINGQGTRTWPDGRKYVGEFRNWQMDGQGKMTYPDGRIEEGLWTKDKFIGASTPP